MNKMIPGGPGGSAVGVGGMGAVADGGVICVASSGGRVSVGKGGMVWVAVGRLAVGSRMPVGVTPLIVVGRQAVSVRKMMKIERKYLIFINRFGRARPQFVILGAINPDFILT